MIIYIRKIFWAIIDSFLNYRKCLDKGKRAFSGRKYDEAQKYYQRVINHLGARKALNNVQKQYLVDALLGQGNIFIVQKNSSAAYNCFNKAFDDSIQVSSLPVDAITLLGATFCKENIRGERATEIYLKYIELKSGDSVATSIYGILEQMSYVDELQDSQVRKKALELNNRIRSIRSKIDWVHYYLGVGTYLENDKTAAEKHLIESARLNEQRALTYYWLGKIYTDLQKSELADQSFLRFTQLASETDEPKKQSEAYLYMGTSIISGLGGFTAIPDPLPIADLNNINKAAAYLEKAFRRDNNSEHIAFSLGRILSSLNMHDQAMEAYKKAIEINNKNGDYYYYLACERKKVDNYAGAIINTTTALSIANEKKYHLLLSELFLLTGNYAGAEQESFALIGGPNLGQSPVDILISALFHQEKYSAIVDTCKKYSKKLHYTEAYPDTLYLIARAYSKGDLFADSVDWYIRLLESDERADAIYYLGCALAQTKDYEKALIAFNRCVKKETQYRVLAHLQCGLVYSNINKDTEAEGSYLAALSVEPDNVIALHHISTFYYSRSENEKASKYLAELLVHDSGHATARFIRGHIYEKKGDISSAVDDYIQVLGSNEVGLKARIRLGIIHFKQRENKKAFEHLRFVYLAGERSDALLFYYGLVCALTNHLSPALESWNILITRYPEDERLALNINRVRYLLGMSYLKEDNLSRVIEEWQEYLKGYPDDIKTRQHTAELYFRLFVREIEKGNVHDAKKLLQKAASLDTNNSKYTFYAALCDYKTGEIDDCINQLDSLDNMDVDLARVKYHKGIALLRKGDKDGAKKLFSAVSMLNEKNYYAYLSKHLMANEYIQSQEYEKAMPILESLLC